jgi:hypothetical protein
LFGESVFGSAIHPLRDETGGGLHSDAQRQQKFNDRREFISPPKHKTAFKPEEKKKAQTTPLSMTVAASPPQATEPPQKNSVLISLTLLTISFLLTLYTHNTCPTSDAHTPCTTFNNLTLGLAVLLAYLAAVGFYTSPDGKVLFPLVAVSYFGVL